MNQEILFTALKAAYEAGKAILPIYNEEIAVEYKEDASPLTEADKQSNDVIKEYLKGIYPILSEEGRKIDFAERKDWPVFWLIDPLDGTKEFIKKNGEFTVNIALIKNGIPVMGVVYVPVTAIMYFGMQGLGSYSTNMENGFPASYEALMLEATSLDTTDLPGIYTVVASRSHMSPETEVFIEEKRKLHGDATLISSGSSLKLCLVAEGKANVYPRLAPTMEWDTAAAHAVAKFAGCRVYHFETGNELQYNKENLLNPWFVVERSPL